MSKRVVLSGSVAYDYLMRFPGAFRDYLPKGDEDSFALSFLVDQLVRRYGGVAPNIAYTLALLGERPVILATVGEDFEPYRLWLEEHGVDTSAIRVIPGEHTASFFGVSDLRQSQLGVFYVGAMLHARELSLLDLPFRPDLVVISPDDVEAMRKRVQECRALEIPYIYDPGQQIVRLSGEDLRQGIEGARALFLNEYEAHLLHQKTGWDLDHWRQRVQDFVVVTRGAQGSTIYTREQQWDIPIAPPRQVADPTGAGDAYRGGFLKGYLHDVDLPTCGRMGALAAAFCVEAQGPQSHHFTWETFRERFHQVFGYELPELPVLVRPS